MFCKLVMSLFMFGLLSSTFVFAGNLEDGIAAEKLGDFNKALASFSKACDQGDSKGCYLAGSIYFLSKYKKIDYKKAEVFYEKACKMKEGKACLDLGLIYNFGANVNIDLKKASDYFEKACSLNIGEGCYNVAFIYEIGLKMRSSHSKAMSLFDKACSLNHPLACYVLGFKYENGEGAEPSRYVKGVIPNESGEMITPLYEKALFYYTRSCLIDSKGEGCPSLAALYNKGLGVPKNEAKAAEILSNSCSVNNGKSCFDLGVMTEHSVKNKDKAPGYFKKACDLGYDKGCAKIKSK